MPTPASFQAVGAVSTSVAIGRSAGGRPRLGAGSRRGTVTPSQLTTRVSPSAFSGAAVSSASSSCSAPSSAHCPTVVNTCWIAVRDGDSGSISPKLSSTSAGTRRAPRNAVTRSSSGTMNRPDIPQRSSIGTRLGPPRSAWYSRRGITTLPHRVIHSLSTTCLKRYTRPSATIVSSAISHACASR